MSKRMNATGKDLLKSSLKQTAISPKLFCFSSKEFWRDSKR